MSWDSSFSEREGRENTSWRGFVKDMVLRFRKGWVRCCVEFGLCHCFQHNVIANRKGVGSRIRVVVLKLQPHVV